MKTILLSAAALVLLCGCTTSSLSWTPAEPGTKSKAGNPALYHLRGMNSGIYLFYFFPLWSGSFASPNWQEYDVFCDRLKEKYVHMLMNSRCKQLKADKVDDIAIQWHSSWVWGLGIFWQRWVTASGIAVKSEKKR